MFGIGKKSKLFLFSARCNSTVPENRNELRQQYLTETLAMGFQIGTAGKKMEILSMDFDYGELIDSESWTNGHVFSANLGWDEKMTIEGLIRNYLKYAYKGEMIDFQALEISPGGNYLVARVQAKVDPKLL